MNVPRLIIYWTIRWLVDGAARLLFALTVEGREHIPSTGPFVLAPVHRSNVDFALAACVTTRRMRFMAKDSLFKTPVFREFIDILGAYPVARGTADREALRQTEEFLKRGDPVVMFPEGTRKSGPVLDDMFEGVAFVAARNHVPIIPVGIGGSERAMPRGAKLIRPLRVHVIVGKPIDPGWDIAVGRPPRRVVRELTARLREELQVLFDEADARVGINR